MTITTKIIITDTNIITDLWNANLLDKFTKLDNVYISDMVKNDEINSNTGDIEVIMNFKTIHSTPEQIAEIFQISQNVNGLSPYDIINYILARDHQAILATGDKKLKNFAENQGIEVMRTLKIIQLLKAKKIISTDEAIHACVLLKKNNCTRIPTQKIDYLIEELKKDFVFE